MYCVKCGASLEPNDLYCGSCGTPVAKSPVADGADGADGAERSDHQAQSTFVIAVVVVAVVAIVAVAVIALVLSGGAGQGGGSSSGAATSSSASSPAASASASSAASPAASASSASSGSASSAASSSGGASQTVEVDGVRVAPMADFASKGLSWEAGAERVNLVDGGGAVLASVVWGDAATRQDEAKRETYHLMVDSSEFALLDDYYLDADSNHVYLGNEAASGVLGTEKAGVTVSDLIGCISYYRNGSYLAAEFFSHPSGTDGYAGAIKSFWGVWIGASKDRAPAEALAEEAEGEGLSASVFLTTDWSNLNPEPWYVVSVGTSSSESEAYALRDEAVAAGYADAYVKYSGEIV